MKTEEREYMNNGDRYCSKCDEFLGSICDPFGRSECSDKCFESENQ